MNSEVPSIQLLGSSEIELHYKRPFFNEMISITSAEDADDILRSYINPNQLDLKECFWVLCLTNANRLTSISQLFIGSTTGVNVSTKEILQVALKTNSTALIVAHSHPSGSLKISATDKKHTNRLKRACRLLDITLLDHLIITSESFVSLAQEGIL